MGKINALNSVNAPISEYRKAKLKLLRKEFRIDVTDEEENHLNTLETQFSVDRYCRTIIDNHWKN
jgi:hypothetical protein